MRLFFKFLSVALLTVILLSEAQLAVMVLASANNELDDIELNELGEKEGGSEEKNDHSSEEVEKFFSAHQLIFNEAPISRQDYHFVYKRSVKANLHFEVICPPPQFFC